MPQSLTIQNRSFTRALMCAALTPSLRSILVFDIPYDDFRMAALQFATMLREVTRRELDIVTLGASNSEDDLWNQIVVTDDSGAPTIMWQPGCLARPPADDRLKLVLIPNLPGLSLPATRATTALMDTEVATLQRYGQDLTWKQDTCWFAACQREEVGQISPHLLDRYALRLSWPGKSSSAITVKELIGWINKASSTQHQPWSLYHLEPATQAELRWANVRQPRMTKAGIRQVEQYFANVQHEGMRRELALARLAVAHAKLEGSRFAGATQVNEAATMIGLISHSPDGDFPRETSSLPADDEYTSGPSSSSQSAPLMHGGSGPATRSTQIMATANTIAQELPDTKLDLPASEQRSDPYPEDTADVQREFHSLRIPRAQVPGRWAPTGGVIGSKPATDLHDIAMVSTILDALKFQRVRRKNRKPRGDLENGGLLIAATDLKSYRRAIVPEQSLVVILDYTCMQGRAWQKALLPHLQWAYVERASVRLVQVGGASAKNMYEARLLLASNVLVPVIGLALSERPGGATPLAHGLELALATLRKELHQSRDAILKSRLVVLTDGRGNVPLEASHTGSFPAVVGREGVEDALRIAEHISNLRNVETYLLNPVPDKYPELPLELAMALRATVVPVPEANSGN